MIRTTALLLALAAFGCSGSSRVHTTYAYNTDQDPVTNEPAHVTSGDMPSGETYTGSYHSPQIGDVFLEQTGDTVVGTYEYERAACHATGRVEGSLQGNLLRFNWTESQAECGRLAPLTGRGYFLLWKDSAENIRINGEWGTGDNDSGGGPWSGLRDRVRRHPQQRTPSNSSGGSVFEDSNGASSGGSSSSGGSTPARKR